ncbi:MAG: hypothetical protein M3R15_33960 [Acidobacteriota bacterium]|nr:hypothetical protein [Acidobacteriota bacterium]
MIILKSTLVWSINRSNPNYDLMMAGGMSYHKSEKKNPKRDETLVLARREEIKKSGAPS